MQAVYRIEAEVELTHAYTTRKSNVELRIELRRHGKINNSDLGQDMDRQSEPEQ